MSEAVVSVEQKLQRNIAVDAYRGLVLLPMMGEVLQFAYVAFSFSPLSPWESTGLCSFGCTATRLSLASKRLTRTFNKHVHRRWNLWG